MFSYFHLAWGFGFRFQRHVPILLYGLGLISVSGLGALRFRKGGSFKGSSRVPIKVLYSNKVSGHVMPYVVALGR